MLSRSVSRSKARLMSHAAVLLGALLLYVVSFGPALACCVHFQTGVKSLNALMAVYRPLALILPESAMRQYTGLCGLSEIEAFYFVTIMRDGGRLPDALGIDCS